MRALPAPENSMLRLYIPNRGLSRAFQRNIRETCIFLGPAENEKNQLFLELYLTLASLGAIFPATQQVVALHRRIQKHLD